ncbi:hypothetical protein VTK56DRAFT_8868 [Thermocarpiscus australiensis]
MAVRLLLLAASAVVLVSAQTPTPDRSTGCTYKSFSIPSWLIEDFKHAADAVSIFHVFEPGHQFHRESGLQNQGKGLESMRHRGKSSIGCLTFTAAGNGSAALNYTSPILIKGGSLLEPVAVTAAYPEVSLIDRTGDGVNTMPYKDVQVILAQPGNGYQASCMLGAGFSYSNSSDLSTLVCAGEEFQSFRVGRWAPPESHSSGVVVPRADSVSFFRGLGGQQSQPQAGLAACHIGQVWAVRWEGLERVSELRERGHVPVSEPLLFAVSLRKTSLWKLGKY